MFCSFIAQILQNRFREVVGNQYMHAVRAVGVSCDSLPVGTYGMRYVVKKTTQRNKVSGLHSEFGFGVDHVVVLLSFDLL